MTPDYFGEGYSAYFDGLTDDDNPYEIGSDEAMSWQDGWSSADGDAEEPKE